MLIVPFFFEDKHVSKEAVIAMRVPQMHSDGEHAAPKGDHFIDVYFPPDVTSLYVGKRKPKNEEHIIWKRAKV